MREFLMKFLSRKLVVTFAVMGCTVFIPVFNKMQNVSDSITMMALGIIGSIAAAYQIANVKDSKIDAEAKEANG